MLQAAGEVSRLDPVGVTLRRLERQHRSEVGVDVAVTRDVDHLEGAVLRQALLQEVRAAALLDHDLQRQAGGGVEDAGFLRLVVEDLLAGRRGGHEHQCEIAIVGRCGSVVGTPADAPEDDEGLGGFRRQEITVEGEGFPGQVEECGGSLAARVADPDLQHAIADRLHPRRGATALVEPGEHLGPDGKQGGHVVRFDGILVAVGPAFESGEGFFADRDADRAITAPEEEVATEDRELGKHGATSRFATMRGMSHPTVRRTDAPSNEHALKR